MYIELADRTVYRVRVYAGYGANVILQRLCDPRVYKNENNNMYVYEYNDNRGRAAIHIIIIR